MVGLLHAAPRKPQGRPCALGAAQLNLGHLSNEDPPNTTNLGVRRLSCPWLDSQGRVTLCPWNAPPSPTFVPPRWAFPQ